MAGLKVIWRAKGVDNVWRDYPLIDGYTRAKNVNMGPLNEGITNQPAALSSQAPGLRASSMRYIDRQNLSNVIGFQAERECDNIFAAMKFAADYPQSLPRNGKLRWEFTDDQGVPSYREMANALIEPPQIVGSNGVVLTIRYTIRGGVTTEFTTADT